MSLLKKLFGGSGEPKKRIRICVECGMPVAEHKDWCSILRGRQQMAQVDPNGAVSPASSP